MLLPPIWILKFFKRQGVHVIGELDIGLLVGDGKAPVGLDKNGMIYKLRTRESWTLNSLDICEPCDLFRSEST